MLSDQSVSSLEFSYAGQMRQPVYMAPPPPHWVLDAGSMPRDLRYAQKAISVSCISSAAWLPDVQKRIAGSIGPSNDTSGKSLGFLIAVNGLRFFQETSDLMPEEPFLSASKLGDLLVEFALRPGTLTFVVGVNQVMGFAAFDGDIQSERVNSNAERNDLRAMVQRVTSSFQNIANGALDT